MAALRSSGEEQLPSDAGSVINNVVYLDGRPAASPDTLAETFQLLERRPNSRPGSVSTGRPRHS